eukprot:TRINITY_DN7967_c0_g1_i2.p1 TRINITY_DN7967_c0_g1~~TRINITY_DN7967_c0_g1_i2.p1  ORF type:complete len:120 (+),score=10.81 TRINITY_DN7967_c0_g1_i2:263-622(+)
MRRIIIFRHNFMKIDKLKIIEKSFLHPIIKFTNSIPGSITNPHHDDTQWVARGLHQGFTIFFDVRHLTVRNDQKYVILGNSEIGISLQVFSFFLGIFFSVGFRFFPGSILTLVTTVHHI